MIVIIGLCISLARGSAQESNGVQSNDTSPLFPIIRDGKMGYIDKAGKVIVTPQYDEAEIFYEGLAKVKKVEGSKYGYGYINNKGQLVIPAEYASATHFSEGLALVSAYFVGGGFQKGFIYQSGKFVFTSIYKPSSPDIYTPQSYSATPRIGSYSVTPVVGDLSEGISLDSTRIDGVRSFSEGLAAVAVDGKWGYINKSGEVVIAPQFEFGAPSYNSYYNSHLIDFSEGLAAIVLKGKYGFIDKTGSVVIQPEYDNVFPFSQGLAAAKTNGKWIFIDKTGEVVIQPGFDNVQPFSEGLAAVEVDGEWGFIDNDGRVIVNFQFMNAAQPNDVVLSFNDGLAAVQVDSKWGYINNTGQIVIQPQYTDALSFYHGLAPVQIPGESSEGKWGYIDKTGRYVWTPTE